MKKDYSETIYTLLLQLESGEYEQVLDQLRGMDIPALPVNERTEVARIYLTLGFIEDAKNVISLLQEEEDLHSTDIQRIQAEIEYKEGNFDNALGIMHELLETNQADDYDMVFISQIYFDDGLPEVAQRYIQKAIQLNSTVPFYFYQKGLYEFEMGIIKNALQSFQEAIQLDTEEPLYHLALGEAYYSAGQFDEASEEYDEVLMKNPDQEEALYLKGLLLIQLSDFSEGIRYLTKVSQLQPENLEILISLVDAYERNHDHSHAQSILERILSIDEYYLPALKRLGEIYLYQEEWQRAKEVLNKALEIDPDDMTLQVMYAKILKAYGDVQEAIQQYELIHQDSPYEEEICENLGELYLRAGDVNKAIECYETQLEIIQDTKIMNQLAACYAETKQYDKALSWIEQSLLLDHSQEKLRLIREQMSDILKNQEE
ncbi:tetratricopeptide repeat protein [Tepidibacillus marianensis]|uniref:tetratricopeptide repeat protein n=1 Tax=Tepidibacillus marianensis TaxID=3131995 RepID=UPI0030CCCF13